MDIRDPTVTASNCLNKSCSNVKYVAVKQITTLVTISNVDNEFRYFEEASDISKDCK